jgi:hypothetical protein
MDLPLSTHFVEIPTFTQPDEIVVLSTIEPSPSREWRNLNFLCLIHGVIANARDFTSGRRDLK